MLTAISLNGVELGTIGFKVRDVRGIWDTPAITSDSTTVPGRAGQLVPPSFNVQETARTIDIDGALVGTSRADFLTKLDALKALLLGSITVVRTETPLRALTARLNGPGVLVAAAGPVFLQRKAPVTISLICDDPYAYDTVLQTVSFTSTATAIPLGTALKPLTGVITLLPPVGGGSAVNPVISYKNSAGTVRETMSFTRTLAPGTPDDSLVIDLTTFQVTRYVAGAPTNDIAAMSTTGGFFAISPDDGNVYGTAYPTLQVSAGRGSISYRRAYR